MAKGLGIFSMIVLITATAFSQIPPYDRYSLSFNEEKNCSQLYDQELDSTYDLWVPYPRRIARFIHTHFVEVRSSDMKCLFNLKGQPILRHSQYIRYFPDRSLITAYENASGNWFILNFDGDTISFARSSSLRYQPPLKEKINVVSAANSYDEAKRLLKWGCINEKGEWLIPVQTGEEPKTGPKYTSLKIFNRTFLLPNAAVISGNFNRQFNSAEQLMALGAIEVKPPKAEKVAVLPSPPSKDSIFSAPRKASYPGGEQQLKALFAKHFNPAVDAHPNSRKVFVIDLSISSDGSARFESLQKGVDKALNREMLRLFTLMGKWSPALCLDEEPEEDGSPNDYHYCPDRIRLIFVLNSNGEWGFLFQEL